METLRRTERPNKGVNSQLYQATADDEKQEREAQKYVWIFYKKGDINPFSLTYNSILAERVCWQQGNENGACSR